MDQEGSHDQQQQSGRLWAAVIFWVALVFLLIVIGGYVQEWKWAGLSKQKLWDWLDLLIVPAVLAVGGYLFTRSENQRTVRSAEQQRTLDREIATQQAETDRTLADERRQDDTLQAYLDGMSQLLTDKELPLHSAQPGDSLSTVARARTLTVLGRLDSRRKSSVLQFLFESGLIYKEQTLLDEGGLIERQHNIVSLQQADLIGADLSRANLFGADLSGANLSEANLIYADLIGAELSGANLFGANLIRANLMGANLMGAHPMGANLSEANLSEANLSEAYSSRANLFQANLRETNLSRATLIAASLNEADLSEAKLRKAVLIEAHLNKADLSGAILSGAVLSDAVLFKANLHGAVGIANEELEQQAATLEGAIMPNGQKYEDWLKSKGGAEDGKSGGSS